MKNQYRHELQQGSAKFNQGAAKLGYELQHQTDINLRLQEQLNFRVKNEPMGPHEMDELNPHSSAEGGISIDPFEGSDNS